MTKKPVSKLKKSLSTVVTAIIWVLIWQVLSTVAKTAGLSLLLPSPIETLKAFGELLTKSDFYISCGKTLLRVLVGWITGMLVGTLLGVLTHICRPLKTFLSPVLHIIKATPVASFIIAALVLMTSKYVPSFTGFLMSLPIVWGNITEGLSSPDKKLLEAAFFFRMTTANKIKYIYIPALKPYFSAAAVTSMGLSWKACVAAEVICTPSDSIGKGIYNAKVYLETPSLFAWTLAVIMLSIILESIIKRVIKLTIKN